MSGRAWSLGATILIVSVLLFQGEVTIHYNKLQADPKQGMSLDIGKPGQSSHVPWALAFSVQANPKG